jgi:hypothetical protein
MAIALGILLMAVGGLAALAAVTAARRAERLRSCGQTAWAMVVSAPADNYDEFGARPARRVLLQYRLPDGAVMERPASRLAPGGTVLVWYDPADPSDVMVLGRDGRLNAAFLTAGILFILLGAVIGGFGH